MSNNYQRLRASNVSEERKKDSDIEMNTIEEAYQPKPVKVKLDSCISDFKHYVQANEFNPEEQKLVKRIYGEATQCFREERFCLRNRDGLHSKRKSFEDEDKSQQHEKEIKKTNKKSTVTKEKMKTNFKSDSIEDLSQPKDESRYKSSASLTSPWTTNAVRSDDIAKSFVLLSGSASGVASIGLQNLVKRYTNISLPGDDKLAWDIIEPHFSKGPPRIRLETVFDIIQQYIDPNLSLLDVLMTDTPSTDRSHDILAKLALTSTVVTTNFDHLIEDAGRYHSGNDPNNIPFRVFCTEEDFKTAYDSITTGALPSLTGLWKIHGTVAIWKEGKRSLVRADEDGGPVATLRRLSSTRESIERRCFLHYLLETRPFVIINYSASDDFDVTRWLKMVKAPLDVLWIQRIDSSLEPVYWSGTDIANSVPEDISSFDRGLIAIACAWHERGIADRLKVVAVADLIGFLLQIAHLNTPFGNNYTHQTNLDEEYLLSVPTSWQSYIVSGAILSHLSYFSEAKRYFDHAASIATTGIRENCIARLAAAEASIEIGNRAGRIQAMENALDAAQTAPLSLHSWACRKAQLISATVKRFVEKDGQAIAIMEIQELLNQCGKPDNKRLGRELNVALEAAILLAQLRRYLPSSPEPSDTARHWIESIPKTGLLHTKGMNLHESALNKYQLATNIEEIDDAINSMKEAIEIREELGHMRGLVASLNVLGSMLMRRFDWSVILEIGFVKSAAEQFRRSIEYSDKHASIFDQFQARIHLAICLLRYPSVVKTNEELLEVFNYFRTETTDDIRTKIESEFCLAMSIFTHSTLSFEEICVQGEGLFDELSKKYTSNNDVRLIRILAAARFNSELCKDWRKGQAHTPDPELTRDITTRKTGTNGNAYWNMRILRTERQIPDDTFNRLLLLLDPLSP